MISVFPPHVAVGSYIHGLGLKWSQHPRVWQDKKGCTLSMSQQAAQKLCKWIQKYRVRLHRSGD